VEIFFQKPTRLRSTSGYPLNSLTFREHSDRTGRKKLRLPFPDARFRRMKNQSVSQTPELDSEDIIRLNAKPPRSTLALVHQKMRDGHLGPISLILTLYTSRNPAYASLSGIHCETEPVLVGLQDFPAITQMKKGDTKYDRIIVTDAHLRFRRGRISSGTVQ
jgi:hypothetical protein